MHRCDHPCIQSSLLLIAGVSSIAGILEIILLSLLVSGIMVYVDIPDKICRLLSIAILASGSFVSGKYGAVRKRKHGIVIGALCGMCTCLIMIIVYIIISEGVTFSNIFIKIFISMLSGAIGGVQGVNKKISKPPI